MATAALTYKKSGVNIDLADKLVDHIAKRAPAILNDLWASPRASRQHPARE